MCIEKTLHPFRKNCENNRAYLASQRLTERFSWNMVDLEFFTLKIIEDTEKSIYRNFHVSLGSERVKYSMNVGFYILGYSDWLIFRRS